MTYLKKIDCVENGFSKHSLIIDLQLNGLLVQMRLDKIWFVLHTEDVGDEGEEEKECITYNVSIDIHYGIKSNR